MRVEPFAVGSIVHVIKRAARGVDVFSDRSDYWRCIRLLFYMNDSRSHDWWEKDTASLGLFGWPELWPKRKPIVKIICHTIMPNHFHLLLKEIKVGGISLFMKKICQSMTLHFNEIHEHRGRGSIFQGAYKGRTVSKDIYFRYVAAYIMVKNVFELYPKGGLIGSIRNFEDAWKWALTYEFSSLPDYCAKRKSPITDKDLLGELFTTKKFKSFAKDVILGGKWEKNSGDKESQHFSVE